MDPPSGTPSREPPNKFRRLEEDQTSPHIATYESTLLPHTSIRVVSSPHVKVTAGVEAAQSLEPTTGINGRSDSATPEVLPQPQIAPESAITPSTDHPVKSERSVPLGVDGEIVKMEDVKVEKPHDPLALDFPIKSEATATNDPTINTELRADAEGAATEGAGGEDEGRENISIETRVQLSLMEGECCLSSGPH